MKKGFTLLELLIVIGIIGVLSGIMLVSFGGSTEKARRMQCMSNMRNLAAAAQSYGMAYSYYPSASSFEYSEMGTIDRKIRLVYYELYGWIGWNEPNPVKTSAAVSKAYNSSHRNESWHTSAYADEKETYHCITNGSLYSFMKYNTACYTCPDHKRLCAKKRINLGWSYAMNAFFGMDRLAFGGTAKAYAYNREYGNIHATLKQSGSERSRELSPDRVLLFAEIPFLEINGVQNPSFEAGSGSGASKTDCTLQYDTITGKSCSNPEAIGFNHKVGNNYLAHVAFADGHVTQIRLPANASESTLLTLTRWLCTGSEIEFDGANYTEAANSN